MNQKKDFLKGIEQEIEQILSQYIKTQSYTYSEGEKEAENFLLEFLSGIPYFKKHPEFYGAYKIKGDAFNRSVCFGMVKGTGRDAVVLVHHNDVVEIEDYKLLKPYAFSPEELEKELTKIKESLHEEAKEDLESGQYIFGRGTADMKGGGSIQLALLKRYSELEKFNGNIIVISVPDEENLSAGMRTAVLLLKELKEKYGLNYKIMINSEPHQRKYKDKGVFSEGSVGKIMPFIYVRGYLAHIGKVFEGFNPLNVMSEVVRRTELNLSFSDVVGDEMAPPPTWLYLKDNKKHYDVSMPMSAAGCFSILTLNRRPQDIMGKVREICDQAFTEIVDQMNDNYKVFADVKKLPVKTLPWEKKVTAFEELYEEATSNYGDKFTLAYEKTLKELAGKLKSGQTNIIECNFELVEFIYQYIDDLSPRIIYGLIPPYYPNVSNVYFKNKGKDIENLSLNLKKFTKEQFNQEYETEDFYTGISDLSYTSIENGEETLSALKRFMPLFGDFYSIPITEIENISMPCMNIGPWGKDFHKLTERVLKEDLYHRTPQIVYEAISLLFNDSAS